jgi:hypothetical protein
VPAGWIPRHPDRAAEREGRRKLRRYFRRMGFRRIGRTKFDGLSMVQQVTTLRELLGPGG